MKLYTEEQVKQIVEKSRETGLTADYLTLTTPAIELPLPTTSKTEKVQTAVEWYSIQEIDLTLQVLGGKISQLQYAMKRVIIIEQAKQMEKEQIQQCWDTAHQAGRFEGKGIAEENWQTFEQYYNETYGK